jgi:NLI interacting factor-like phosphatase
LKEVQGKTKINHVTVFERPGLREFFQEVSKFADLVLFTAGLEGLNYILSLHHAAFVFLGVVPNF